ncbi:MAG: hypothetical protein ABR540_18660 [Acidimicrobiales bacterium]
MTIDELLELGRRGGLEGTQDLGADIDPGVDPPYDPTKELQDIRAPWSPPSGPGEIASTPHSRPTGPGGLDSVPPPPPTPFDRVRPVSDGCIGSKFVYKATTGQWLPSFGWRARVWVRNADSVFVEAHVEELDSFGEWQFCPTISEMGRELLYAYESANRLVELIDTRESYYGPYYVGTFWGMTNPPQPGIYPSPDVTPWVGEPGVVIKTKAMDTGSANFEGDDPNYIYAVGDIMRWSMEALTTAEAFGVKVERTEPGPHRILYPNTTYDCGTKYEVWSCYSHGADRPIYLGFVYEHVNRVTVQHELAHSISAQYKGRGPGGTHHLDSCHVDTPLAYSEGFAIFFAVWSHTPDRFSAPYPGDDGIDIESPSPCLVEFGATSEVWVAAALWDLHDKHVDGDDTLGAAGFGGIVRLYLEEPVQFDEETNPINDIKTLRSLYLSKLSPSSKVWANAVFSQNHIEP